LTSPVRIRETGVNGSQAAPIIKSITNAQPAIALAARLSP
jgi:hypothetical protein